MMYLMRCIKQSPNHPEACATAAYIEAENGNTAEALNLMTAALKTGYTDARVKFIDDISPGRSSELYGLGDIDLKVDYYLKSNFNLPPNCRNWNSCEDVYEAQQAFAQNR